MVLEETMQRVNIFKYLGGFSIAKNSKQIMGSLNYAAELLSNPDNMVLIFPQGKLYSNFVDAIAFEKGLLKIAAQAAGNFQYVFAATFIENLEHKKPVVNISFKTYKEADIVPGEIQRAYQRHYQSAKLQQTTIIV